MLSMDNLELIIEKTRNAPTKWTKFNNIVEGNKVISASELGLFEKIFFKSVITSKNFGYECEISAQCLPVALSEKKIASSLSEAKRITEETWMTLASGIIITFMAM